MIVGPLLYVHLPFNATTIVTTTTTTTTTTITFYEICTTRELVRFYVCLSVCLSVGLSIFTSLQRRTFRRHFVFLQFLKRFIVDYDAADNFCCLCCCCCFYRFYSIFLLNIKQCVVFLLIFYDVFFSFAVEELKFMP